METSTELVQEIVAKIMKEMSKTEVVADKKCGCNGGCGGNGSCKGDGNCKSHEDYIFSDVDPAVAAAKEAYKKLKNLSIKDREKIIQKIREKCLTYAERLSMMAVDETGMGRVEDKITKHLLVAEKTPGTEDLTTTAWSGDGGLTLVEQGPFGVIAAITPSTNPTATVFCNSIGMIAAGNTVVFAPHPGAKECSKFAVKLVNEASIEAGGPKNIVVTFDNPSIEITSALMNHKDVPFISATGGPGVVKQACSAGKRAIGAGAGNPPVIVDETSDIKAAARDIIDGATFDNNLPCIAEKEVVAVEQICDELIVEMQKNGAYLLEDPELVKKLVDTVLIKKGDKRILNRKFVGRDAKVILDAIGVYAEDSVRCIIFKGCKKHLLVVEELMMPILGIVTVKYFEEAVEVAVELEHGNRHSAHMHSKNIDRLTYFAREVDTAIFVKNAPSYSALGVGAEGYPTFTIASKTGEGLSSAKTFTKARRCVLKDSLSIK